MHKRVTCGRIFYQGKEHSAVYYNGEEQFEIGVQRDEGESVRPYSDPSNDYYGWNSEVYQELRNTYSNADYPLKQWAEGEGTKKGAYRWRVDWDSVEFSYTEGGFSIGIRGDGIVKFNDGSRQLVKTKVIHDTDGKDYISTEKTYVYCPHTATKGIFVGTFSPLGMVRYNTKNVKSDTALALNSTLGMLDFSSPSITNITVEYEQAQSEINGRPQSRMTFAFVIDFLNMGAERIKTTYNGKSYYLKELKPYSVRDSSRRVFDWYYDAAAMMNLRYAFAYSGLSTVPIGFLKKLGNLRQADAEYEDHLNTSDSWTQRQGYQFAFTDHYTGTIEGIFQGCKNITTLPADTFTALKPCDCWGAFKDCTGLTKLPEGLFDWFYQQRISRHIDRKVTLEGKGLVYNMVHAQLREAFKGCINLRGSTPTITMKDGSKKKIWEIPVENNTYRWEDARKWIKGNGETAVMPRPCMWCNGCFEGCTGLDDYDEIPDTWKLPLGKAILTTPLVSDYTGETIRVFDIEDSGDPNNPADWART